MPSCVFTVKTRSLDNLELRPAGWSDSQEYSFIDQQSIGGGGGMIKVAGNGHLVDGAGDVGRW